MYYRFLKLSLKGALIKLKCYICTCHCRREKYFKVSLSPTVTLLLNTPLQFIKKVNILFFKII